VTQSHVHFRGEGEGARPGVVFVGELTALDDASRYSGRFAAHWESLDGASHEMGPVDVSAEEAIAWGRSRADEVLVRIDGEMEYSAGAKAVTDLPAWPDEGVLVRERPMQSKLDGSEQQVAWLVVVDVDLRGDYSDLVAKVASDPRVDDVIQSPPERGQFEVVVTATGVESAVDACLHIMSRSLRLLTPPLEPADVALRFHDVRRSL
jgi:hypothetical protein